MDRPGLMASTGAESWAGGTGSPFGSSPVRTMATSPVAPIAGDTATTAWNTVQFGGTADERDQQPALWCACDELRHGGDLLVSVRPALGVDVRLPSGI